MKILYITSLYSVYSSSAAIRNFGYINGISNLIGKDNLDVITISRPEKMIDNEMENLTKCNKVYYDEIKIIKRYFKDGGKEKSDKLIKRNKVFRSLKKILVETLYFPAVDKEWVNVYSKLNFHKYDCIISSSDSKTSHLVALDIKEKNPTLKWVQIWGDPWSTDITLNKLSKFRAKKREKELLKKANLVFYVSEPTMNEMKNIYKEFKNKIHCVPRGYAMEITEEKNKLTNEIKMLYTGAINKRRNIAEFSKALNEYNKKNNIKIKLRIFGNIDLDTRDIVDKNEFIDYCGLTDYFGVLNEYKKSHVLLYVDNGEGATQIPGKLYDYLGTNNCVLAIVNNMQDATSKFIENTNRVVMSLNNKDDILTAFEKVTEEVKENKNQPFRAFSSNIAIEKIVKKIRSI